MEGLLGNSHRDNQAAYRPSGLTEQAGGRHADLPMRQLARGRFGRDAGGRFSRSSAELARNAKEKNPSPEPAFPPLLHANVSSSQTGYDRSRRPFPHPAAVLSPEAFRDAVRSFSGMMEESGVLQQVLPNTRLSEEETLTHGPCSYWSV